VQVIGQGSRGGKSDSTALREVPECAESSSLCDGQSECFGNNENRSSGCDWFTDLDHQHGRVQESIRQEGRESLSDSNDIGVSGISICAY